MAIICNECKKTVEDFSPYGKVIKPYYKISVAKREQNNPLISDLAFILCKEDYSKLTPSLTPDLNQIQEDIFLAVENEERYQFIDWNTTEKIIPKTSKDLKNYLEKRIFKKLKSEKVK